MSICDRAANEPCKPEDLVQRLKHAGVKPHSQWEHAFTTGGTISGAAKGTEPGQIIMCAPEGEVLVEASEDESFIYLDFPSGVRKKAPKGQFLRKLDDETNHWAPTGE
jgi:hypothetical protein